MSNYILLPVIGLAMLIIAALISNSIKFETGSNPKDPRKRKIVFWTFFVLNPVVGYIVSFFLMAPEKGIARTQHLDSLGLAVGIGIITYLLIGFGLSKIMKTSKIGTWF